MEVVCCRSVQMPELARTFLGIADAATLTSKPVHSILVQLESVCSQCWEGNCGATPQMGGICRHMLRT